MEQKGQWTPDPGPQATGDGSAGGGPVRMDAKSGQKVAKHGRKRSKKAVARTVHPVKHRSRMPRFLQWLIPLVVVVGVAAAVIAILVSEPPLPPLKIDLQKPVLSAPTATVEQAQKWARSKGATKHFIELAPLYWELAPQYGVDPVVAYAQFGLETNYGRFGGVIDESYHNPCGLKTTKGGDDQDPTAHQRFPTWEDGVRAQYEHLCLYAGAPGYPLEHPLDPRHFPQLLGTAETVGEIGERWASSKHYGALLAELIDRIQVQHVS